MVIEVNLLHPLNNSVQMVVNLFKRIKGNTVRTNAKYYEMEARSKISL